jgi:hypothetical protein
MRSQHVREPRTGGWAHHFRPTEKEGEEIRRALGATTIFALRQAFGSEFAYGVADGLIAGDALQFMDPQSKAMLIRNLRGQIGSGAV